ncbi:MAG: TetR/AcrR family transcriptional regulator [Cellvibrionaceae bacterium]
MAGTRQFNEADMLDKALSLFWRKGYKATSMIDLANETGVQRGSLYNAYNNKSTLFIKAFDNYSKKLLKLTEESLSDPQLKTAIMTFFESMTRRLCKESSNNGCLSTRAIMEANEQDEHIRNKLVQLLDDIERAIQQRLEKGVKDKEFSGDPEETARYLVTLTRGLAVIERVYYDESRIQKIYCTAIKMLPFHEN